MPAWPPKKNICGGALAALSAAVSRMSRADGRRRLALTVGALGSSGSDARGFTVWQAARPPALYSAAGVAGAAAAVFAAARRRKRSPWPPVSMIRWVPVKKGWHTEQTSVFSSAIVEPVVKVLPHRQVTTVSVW